MALPIFAKERDNYVLGTTWNIVISSMVMAAKFNHDAFEYNKIFSKFFSAKRNHASLTVLLHQYLSLVEFTLNVTSE